MKIIYFLLIILSCLLPVRLVFAQEQKWPGVDKTIVEKYAEEHGRKAIKPLINTDQGDLLLFMFLLGGSAAGFAAGYYWRILMENKPGGNGLASVCQSHKPRGHKPEGNGLASASQSHKPAREKL